MRSRSAAARIFHASILIAAFATLALLWAGAAPANAQTAHFSGAIRTMGSGFNTPTDPCPPEAAAHQGDLSVC